MQAVLKKGLPLVTLSFAGLRIARWISSTIRQIPSTSGSPSYTLSFLTTAPLSRHRCGRSFAHRSIRVSFAQRKPAKAEEGFARLEPELRAARVLGLDTEWKNQNPTSLLQIATQDRVLLVRLSSFRESGLPAALTRVLTDPDVIKTGVGIAEDVERLAKGYGVRIRGALDLRAYLALHLPREHMLQARRSLASQAQALLGVTLEKAEHVTRSNWEGKLSTAQTAYAAADAWLSRELLVEMCRLQEELQLQLQCNNGAAAAVPAVHVADARGLRPQEDITAAQFAQLQLSAVNLVDTSISLVDRVTGARMEGLDPGAVLMAEAEAGRRRAEQAALAAAKRAREESGAAASSSAAPTTAETAAAGPVAPPAARSAAPAVALDPTELRAAAKMKKLEGMALKRPLYDNARLEGPDGTTLCTLSRKKADWYVTRGLGEVVSEDGAEAFVVRLKFAPKGSGHADDRYYIAQKENRCVICGGEDKFVRHHVVPFCYRKFFPETMKSHLSHDIVLLCAATCHPRTNALYHQRMKELGVLFHAPIESESLRVTSDRTKERAKAFGQALRTAEDKMPEARREELRAFLRDFFGLETDAVLTQERLEEAASLETRSVVDPERKSHAEVVASAVLEGGPRGVEEFVRDWRRFFLERLEPKFLPPFWSVDARTENSSQKELAEK